MVRFPPSKRFTRVRFSQFAPRTFRHVASRSQSFCSDWANRLSGCTFRDDLAAFLSGYGDSHVRRRYWFSLVDQWGLMFRWRDWRCHWCVDAKAEKSKSINLLGAKRATNGTFGFWQANNPHLCKRFLICGILSGDELRLNVL